MIRFFACATILLQVGLAQAQPVPSTIGIGSFNPENPVAPVSTVEGPGIKVGEGTVLRPVVGFETGVLTNVFYEEEQTNNSGVLRLLAQLGIASLGSDRLAGNTSSEGDPQQNNGQFVYRADLRVAYDLLISGNETVTDTGGLGVGATLKGIVNPDGRVAFQFADDFNRLIRAANFETNVNTNRDINNLSLVLQYKPRDRSIGGNLYYNNTLDIFEREEQNFANRIMHRVGVHPFWQFLPNTQAYLDVSLGRVSALDDASSKSGSWPFVARAGLNTLLNISTTLNIDAGYTNGFYDAGPSFSGPTIGTNIGYRYSPLGRISAGYILTYQDSINANFYRDHVIHATLQQGITPLLFMIQPELHFRHYEGVTQAVPMVVGPDVRDDVIVSVIAGAHYNFRNWIAATLDYRFSMISTDYQDMSGSSVDDPSYVRHEVLLGMRVAL